MLVRNCYLLSLHAQTMMTKFLTNCGLTKDKNDENVPHLEINRFTDQNCKPLEIEDKINIILVIN